MQILPQNALGLFLKPRKNENDQNEEGATNDTSIIKMKKIIMETAEQIISFLSTALIFALEKKKCIEA